MALLREQYGGIFRWIPSRKSEAKIGVSYAVNCEVVPGGSHSTSSGVAEAHGTPPRLLE